MSERVVASNSGTETPEDFLERIQRDHSLIYETVRTYIPEGWEDGCRVKGDFDTTSIPLIALTGDGGI